LEKNLKCFFHLDYLKDSLNIVLKKQLSRQLKYLLTEAATFNQTAPVAVFLCLRFSEKGCGGVCWLSRFDEWFERGL